MSKIAYVQLYGEISIHIPSDITHNLEEWAVEHLRENLTHYVNGVPFNIQVIDVQPEEVV